MAIFSRGRKFLSLLFGAHGKEAAATTTTRRRQRRRVGGSGVAVEHLCGGVDNEHEGVGIDDESERVGTVGAVFLLGSRPPPSDEDEEEEEEDFDDGIFEPKPDLGTGEQRDELLLDLS